MFREFDYGQGRWLSPDPAGLAVVDDTNPQSFNRYAYVGNNPTTNTDPSGLIGLAPTGCDPFTGIGCEPGGGGCDPWTGECGPPTGPFFPVLPPVVGGGGGGGRGSSGGSSTSPPSSGGSGVDTSRPSVSGLGLESQAGIPPIFSDPSWVFRIIGWGWPWAVDIGEGAAIGGVVACEAGEPCGAIADLIFAGAFVLANSQRSDSRRLVTARCQCTVIDLDSGVDAGIGFVTGVGTGTDWASAYTAAKRNAGANAAAQYPGRRVRVKHCRPA